MENYQDEILQIKEFLRKDPRGLNIKEISKGLKLNRNSVAKYLDILTTREEVDVRIHGTAKVYYLSQNVPISNLMKFSSKYIVVVNQDLRIVQVNDAFTRFIKLPKKQLLQLKITEIPSDILQTPAILDTIDNAVLGKEIISELSVKTGMDTLTFNITFTPTRFQDQSPGVILVFEDITRRKEIEKVLRESEEKYRNLIENIFDVVFSLDPEGIITYVSPQIASYGYKPEEIISKIFDPFIFPNDRKRVRQLFIDILKTGKRTSTPVFRIIDNLNRPIWVEWTGRVQQNESGVVTGLLGVLRNITDRKQAEEANRINSERLRMAQKIGHIGSWELDLATGRIWGSEEAFRIFAVPRPSDGFSSIKDVEARIPDWEGVHRALTDLIENGAESKIEYAIEPADNSPRKIIHSVGKIIYDAEKKPVGVAGVVHDITALKQAEEGLTREHKELNAAYIQLAAQEGELRQRMNDIVASQLAMRESEEKYVSLFNRSLDLIYIHDLAGNFIDANPAALALLGYTRDDISRLSFASLISAEQIKKAQERIKTIVENGSHPDLIEYRLQKKNGEFVDVEAKGSLILKDEKPYAILGIARDITERKRAEEALRMTNRKLQLLSGISRHDIQNQLMSLRGAISFIDSDHLDDESRKWIRIAEKAAETITGQIGFTKDYENLGIKEPRWQSISEIFRHATLQFLMCDISLDMPADDYEIYADQLLEKVFYNLLDNTLRHGGDVTCISLSCREDDDGLKIFIQDNGWGVRDGDKLLIFGQGFGRNTGLGLFLVREILSITGITIVETGTYRNGAQFEIRVPKGGYRIKCDT